MDDVHVQLAHQTATISVTTGPPSLTGCSATCFMTAVVRSTGCGSPRRTSPQRGRQAGERTPTPPYRGACRPAGSCPRCRRNDARPNGSGGRSNRGLSPAASAAQCGGARPCPPAATGLAGPRKPDATKKEVRLLLPEAVGRISGRFQESAPGQVTKRTRGPSRLQGSERDGRHTAPERPRTTR